MKQTKPTSRATVKKNPKVGGRMIEGWKRQLRGRRARTFLFAFTHVQIPDVDVSKVRRQMGLTQRQFALKFGFPPAMLPELGAGAGSAGYTDTTRPGLRT